MIPSRVNLRYLSFDIFFAQGSNSWGGWQERQVQMRQHQELLRLQDRYGGGRGQDDCGSGLSRESSRDDIRSEDCEQQFEYEQVG